MITTTRKRGDTRRLRFHTEFALDDVTITAAALDSGGVTRALQAGVINLEERLYEVWGIEMLPVGRHVVDVKYERLGHVQRSDNKIIQITEAITP